MDMGKGPMFHGHGESAYVSWTWGKRLCFMDLGKGLMFHGRGERAYVSWTWGKGLCFVDMGKSQCFSQWCAVIMSLLYHLSSVIGDQPSFSSH